MLRAPNLRDASVKLTPQIRLLVEN